MQVPAPLGSCRCRPPLARERDGGASTVREAVRLTPAVRPCASRQRCAQHRAVRQCPPVPVTVTAPRGEARGGGAPPCGSRIRLSSAEREPAPSSESALQLRVGSPARRRPCSSRVRLGPRVQRRQWTARRGAGDVSTPGPECAVGGGGRVTGGLWDGLCASRASDCRPVSCPSRKRSSRRRSRAEADPRPETHRDHHRPAQRPSQRPSPPHPSRPITPPLPPRPFRPARPTPPVPPPPSRPPPPAQPCGQRPERRDKT